MSIEPIILGWNKGVRLKAFFSRDPRYDYLLAVLDNSPIRSLADFKGKDIGEINVGNNLGRLIAPTVDLTAGRPDRRPNGRPERRSARATSQ